MGSLAGIPISIDIGMGSYTIGVMIRITGSMRFQDSSYTPLDTGRGTDTAALLVDPSPGIRRYLEAGSILECSRSPEVYRCRRYWDPYHSGAGFYWDYIVRCLLLYWLKGSAFKFGVSASRKVVLFSQQQAAIPLIRNRDSIFHTGSQYVLISTAVDRRYGY